MINRIKRLGSIGLITIGLIVTGCSLAQGPAPISQAALASEINVFRSPTCGCCGLWIEHMRDAGFEVNDQITEDMAAIKEQYGVPENLKSCHTTVVDGYIVEGHIPAEDVAQLLTEKPDIAGIAVPGMPIGSPGMESGNYVEPYTVFSFEKDGLIATFAEHS
ncbi:DUF411 domain-containing protein [Leptolyngbyaceae cyanobacterium CCMR0082]|uniref:DUF411 domain-containing protein n=1 Tax=Adonisia turfae CCMR0082 TaxID=2304604 RepID=A0A6M0SE69_9CYAN|nr:DUF411 domain-containing protein [Adonisia turfae]MDV3350120.1 DUF411 domain-containing protein [Leptothoe sp. LEGE 181152]NEZ66353.1 DUF411 domain-containing protein [Adonisia turfae CCMR0082]